MEHREVVIGKNNKEIVEGVMRRIDNKIKAIILIDNVLELNYLYCYCTQQHIIQLQQQFNYMDNSSSVEPPPPSRDYKCPCGKTYLSYPAIFTHIKQKHNGKAPGPIQKPKLQSKPRGRPPLSMKKDQMKDERTAESKKKEEDSLLNMKKQNNPNYKYFEGFQEIYVHLKEIEYQEYIEKEVWNDLEAFHKFDQFIDSKKNRKDFRYVGVSIGNGLSEFLKMVSTQIQSWRFEQVLLLFMLLLQYTIDETNEAKIISQAPVEFFLQYLNTFICEFIKDEGERLGLQSLWIMKRENIQKIFMCFYNWLKWKEYTLYSMTFVG